MSRYAGPRGGNRGDYGGNRGNYGGNRGDYGGNSGDLLTFARDHADSPASPLLSGSLVAVRDAITGHWKGNRTVIPNARDLQDNLEESYFDKVRLPYQELILECMLKGRISVAGDYGSATLVADGKAITKIERPDPEYFEESLYWIRAYADLRDDRVGEIHMQLDDMLSFFGALAHLDLGRRKYTLMLLDVARSLAIHVETPMKFFCPAVRPNEYAMEVQPMIQTPDHSTYPSGHAMEAFAIATVLHRLSSGKGPAKGIKSRALPFRLAHRIAVNRTVAGVHFPVDSLAGAWVGCFVGELIHAFAITGAIHTNDLPKPELERKKQDNEAVPCHDKPEWERPDDFQLPGFLSYFAEPSWTRHTIEKIGVAQEIWRRARKEWPGVRTVDEEPFDV